MLATGRRSFVRLASAAALALTLLLGASWPSSPSPLPASTPPLSKFWVFFADKNLNSNQRAQAVAQVAATYNPRAAARRLLRGDAAKRAGQVFDERDLPVAQLYLDAVTQTGARPVASSCWLNAVSVQATPDQLQQIAALPFVRHVQPVARGRRIEPLDVHDALLPSANASTERTRLDYGLATVQLTQINLIALHDAGYTGQDVIVGILDTGFHRTHDAFNYPAHPLAVVAEHDFINNDGNTDQEPNDPATQHYHGTYILGTLGAYLPGNLVGGAFDASFILCKTEDTTQEVPVEEDYYVAGLEFIEANGGDMATSSLGYIDWYTQQDLDGQTAVTTIAVNIATANGVHCCTAAMNMGHDNNSATSHLGAPADAFQVITCGAVDSGGVIASFSSDGPTADGRVKPEVLARGVSTNTVSPTSDSGYTSVSGTSLSTPLVAGAVACLIQAHPAWTVDQMRDFLFHTASDYVANGTYDPLFIRGYGIIDAHAASLDCNANGVPDRMDLIAGTSTDVNNDGIPDECESVGDLNCDGVVDFGDINPFVLYLSQYAAWLATYPGCDPANGDINGDGVYGQTSFGDINPFVALLSAGR
jgi:subtilisin family serine protease